MLRKSMVRMTSHFYMSVRMESIIQTLYTFEIILLMVFLFSELEGGKIAFE